MNAGSAEVHGGSRVWGHLRISRLVFLIASLQLLGTLWFCGGFLLSRVQVGLVSHASTPVQGFEGSGERLAPPPFDKALLLVVDALRLDFVHAQPYSLPGAAHVGAMNQTLQAVHRMVRAWLTCMQHAQCVSLRIAQTCSTGHSCAHVTRTSDEAMSV